MCSDVAAWCHLSTTSQALKIQPHVELPVLPIPMPMESFAEVHMDIVATFTLVYLFVKSFLLLDQVAWSNTTHQNYHGQVYQSFVSWLDCLFLVCLCIFRDFLLWMIVWVIILDLSSADTWDFSSTLICVSPTVQWHVQAVLLDIQMSLQARSSSCHWVQDLAWILCPLYHT